MLWQYILFSLVAINLSDILYYLSDEIVSADYVHYVLRGGFDLKSKDRTVYLQAVNGVKKD